MIMVNLIYVWTEQQWSKKLDIPVIPREDFIWVAKYISRLSYIVFILRFFFHAIHLWATLVSSASFVNQEFSNTETVLFPRVLPVDCYNGAEKWNVGPVFYLQPQKTAGQETLWNGMFHLSVDLFSISVRWTASHLDTHRDWVHHFIDSQQKHPLACRTYRAHVPKVFKH